MRAVGVRRWHLELLSSQADYCHDVGAVKVGFGKATMELFETWLSHCPLVWWLAMTGWLPVRRLFDSDYILPFGNRESSREIWLPCHTQVHLSDGAPSPSLWRLPRNACSARDLRARKWTLSQWREFLWPQHVPLKVPAVIILKYLMFVIHLNIVVL